MINSELLKEAIADAKAVRATALANAKAALEEAFAPRFEAMFADKLKEESEEEEEGMSEEVNPTNLPSVTQSKGEAQGKKPKSPAKSAVKQPKSAPGDKDFKAVKVGLGPKDVPNLGKVSVVKRLEETAEEEEEEGKAMDEQYEEQEECKTCGKSPCACDESVQEAGLTSEDLDEIIKELENEVADEEEGKRVEEPAPPAPEEEPAPEGGEEGHPPVAGGGEGFPPAPEGGEEADVEAEPGSEVDINLGPEAGGEAGAMPPQGMNAGVPPEEPGQEDGAMPPQFPPKGGEGDEDENINLEELLAALNEESDEEDEGKEEEMDESLQNQGLPTSDLAGQDKTGGTNTYPKGPLGDSSQKHVKKWNFKGGDGESNIGSGTPLGKPSMSEQYKVALKEAYKTIEFLRGQINEVNLLNAKLLYTNKLFKDFAGVLDDSYRYKIIESFDLTKNVREVKLAYALLAESLNFGTQMAKVPAKQIAKPAQQKQAVKQITEGFASKPVSSTRPSQLITEGNEMALRFKKLAGIKEAPKTTSEKK